MLALFWKDNWEAIIVAGLVAVLTVYIHVIKVERDEARADVATLRAAYEQQVTVEQGKLAQAQETQATVSAASAKQIAELKLDRDSIAKALRRYYAKSNDTASSNNAGIVLPSTADSSTASTTSGGQESTEGGGVCGATCAGLETEVKVLTEALVLETIDFNSARARVDQDCVQVGCLK